MKQGFEFRRGHVGRALARCHWLFEEQVAAGIHARGFGDYRHADGHVLRVLPVDGASRIVDLAERARMTKQGMGKLVSGLQARGYLAREPDPDDGRAHRVTYTPRGEALLSAAGEAIADLEAQWSDVIGARQLDDIKQTLLALADALGPGDYL